MSTVMHEPNKSWDPGTIAPYMRKGSTSCQEYDAFSKLRNLDIDRTQHHRLFQPSHPNRTGRGGRFGRGGGQARNQDNSQRAYSVKSDKVVVEALLIATVEVTESTECTATIAPGMSLSVHGVRVIPFTPALGTEPSLSTRLRINSISADSCPASLLLR